MKQKIKLYWSAKFQLGGFVYRERLRMILPDGRVLYSLSWSDGDASVDFADGCTSRKTQAEAIEAAREYSHGVGETFEYIGEI